VGRPFLYLYLLSIYTAVIYTSMHHLVDLGFCERSKERGGGVTPEEPIFEV